MRHRHRLVRAALLAAVLLAPVRPAFAQDATGDPATGDGPRKLLAYAACSATVFASTNLPSLILALGTCGKLVLDEMGL
ncbi:MAG: hypothetical protein U0704_17840 [Candidatus Eisenbacteria bacterium]